MTPSGGGGGTGKCHRMTQGGGGAKVSRDIFSQNFELYSCILDCFLEGKRLLFWKIKMSSHTGGGGGRGVRASVTK